jgi:hypothetical protein
MAVGSNFAGRRRDGETGEDEGEDGTELHGGLIYPENVGKDNDRAGFGDRTAAFIDEHERNLTPPRGGSGWLPVCGLFICIQTI